MYIDNPAAPLVVVNSYHCCIQIPPKLVSALNYTAVCVYTYTTSHCSMYIYTQQCRNSTCMKLRLQATLKWAAQRMHSKVIRLVMHNANTLIESQSIL